MGCDEFCLQLPGAQFSHRMLLTSCCTLYTSNALLWFPLKLLVQNVKGSAPKKSTLSTSRMYICTFAPCRSDLLQRYKAKELKTLQHHFPCGLAQKQPARRNSLVLGPFKIQTTNDDDTDINSLYSVFIYTHILKLQHCEIKIF